jgi:3-oxoacyl-[acyl-carrier-protein] synthase-1
VATGFEPGHFGSEHPYRGEGLSATLAALFEVEDVHAPIRAVYSSMNGENYWAKEWGVARIRHAACFDEETTIQHPSDCFRDAGAAMGPILVGLAALTAQADNRGQPALVYCSSDAGERAALLVSAPRRSSKSRELDERASRDREVLL